MFLTADGTGREEAAEACAGLFRRGAKRTDGVFDFLRLDAAEEMVKEAEGKPGGVNILVSNAGIPSRRPPLRAPGAGLEWMKFRKQYSKSSKKELVS